MKYKVTRDSSYLAHHGILGMHWGIRKKEELVGDHRNNQQEESKPKSISQNSEEIRQKANARRNDLIKEYTKKGMSPQRARIAANKKLALEKAAVFGLTAGAIAGIAAYEMNGGSAKALLTMAKNIGNVASKTTADDKIALSVLDKIGKETLKSPKVQKLAIDPKPFVDDIVLDLKDVPLQRITGDADTAAITAHEAFYASFDKIDNQKYLGGYGAQIMNSGCNKVYEMLISPKSPIKVAGSKTAEEEFGKLLVSNPEFRKNFQIVNDNFANNGFLAAVAPERGALHKTIQAALTQGNDFNNPETRTAAYKAFNIGLVNHSAEGNALSKEFYDALKSKGYHAIEDVNDQMYSGYRSKHPLIIFNPKDTVGDTKVRDVSTQEIVKAQTWFMRMVAQGR